MVSLLSHLKKINFKKSISCALVCAAGFAGFQFWQLQKSLPSFEQYRSQFSTSDKVLYAEDGKVLSSLRTNYHSRVLGWSSLENINADFVKALVQKEDHRFYGHPGVDILTFPGVAIDVCKGKKMRGASTISMQLAKIIYKIQTKSFFGKLRQMIYALAIETRWTKSQILESYLSTVPVKADIKGIASASFLLLQKSALYLTANEQKIFLKLINEPSIKWNVLIDKVCQADLKCSQELIAIEKKSNEFMAANSMSELNSVAYHLHRHLLTKSKSEIHSSVNYDLQVFAQETLRGHIAKLKDKNVHDGALVVLDNATGNILAYVGSSGLENSQAPYVDMVKAERQLGSTVKPFLYATALEKQVIKLSSWIEDSPVQIIFPNGTYSPSNHDHQYHGWVHPGTALASSLNVPAVKMIQLIGIEEFWNTLHTFGFKVDREPDFYGPSLALGVVDGSLWQLTQAYRKLAIGSEKLFSAQTLNQLRWMLSHSPNRALSFGQDSILNVPHGFAVKTGTSKDMKDNWCVGFNQDYTVGVWVGNANSSSMENVLGVTGAAPIWRGVVDYLLNLKSSKEFLNKDLADSFLNEELSAVAPRTFNKSHILTPGKQAIYAIDPGIPARAQKILFEADGPQQGLIWHVHGKKLSDRKWTPETGWQKVELYRGQEKLDESVFLVK